jgi:multidrug efflux pump subunit AcrB
MIEALDAQRRRRKDPRETVQVATRKVSRAMTAATLTAVLSFTPLLFVSGILGEFIRAIPTTVIISLLTSLVVALVFIPVFARYLLLGKKQMGEKNVHEPAAGIEAKIANFISKPMLWARGSTKKLLSVGLVAVFVGVGFIMAAGFLFQKVTFNIFPPSKDSNGLMILMNFAPGATVEQAEEVADRANKIVGETVGKEFRYATNYSLANAQNATLTTYITPYSERDIRAPEIVNKLEEKFKGFEGATVTPRQLDVGPPAAAFSVRIMTDDREAGMRLAEDINKFLMGKELVRLSGETAHIETTMISDPGVYSRSDGDSFIEVSATFDSDDTTTLVTLAEDAVKEEYDADKLAEFGFTEDVLSFDFGQEDENQESFKNLVIAFPIMLFAIYILLSIQFRSLVQPLLIFMAIPFSLFGITLGLYVTDNPFSFFGMLGFFALIGLSIKNTILLTDYANQLRRSGAGVIDSAVGALGERFRPLIATSLTAVASMIPLALTSPFWEGLMVVLIFGLLSSTFLVIIVFPYYYLGVEFMRLHVSRRAGLTWLGLTVALSFLAVQMGMAGMIPLIALATAIGMGLAARARRKRRTA